MLGSRQIQGDYHNLAACILSDVINHTDNLQNARSFLLAQQQGLEKVLKVYDRMETLSLRAMDPVITVLLPHKR